MTIKEACSTIHVFRSVKSTTLSALEAGGLLKSHKKGELLFIDRTKVTHFYFIVSGTAALYKLNHQQDKKVIFIYGKGEMLNEVMLQDEYASINCEILSNTLVFRFPIKKFIELMAEDFNLANAVMKSMAVKIRRLYHQLKNTSNSMRLDKQIAGKLWKLVRDHGNPCEQGYEIGFDLSISYLADMVGSKRETVSRQVKSLSEKGLILVKKNRFYILDKDKLKEYFKET